MRDHCLRQAGFCESRCTHAELEKWARAQGSNLSGELGAFATALGGLASAEEATAALIAEEDGQWTPLLYVRDTISSILNRLAYQRIACEKSLCNAAGSWRAVEEGECPRNPSWLLQTSSQQREVHCV